MATVTYEHVTKRFNDVIAVDDISLQIADKEFLVLVGPSGCGKTTVLRLLAGLEEITKGVIMIDQKVINDVPPKDRDIAMVFQSYALYPHMSVFDNMAFSLMLRKISKEEIKRRVQEAAEILGIENLLNRKPAQLSGGQRQRVAVGRAIVREPKVFLFDEPLSNLDAKLRIQTRAEISKLHQRLQATFVYVTHDQVEAMTMATKIAVMKDGLVQQIDTPQNVYERPSNVFVAGFIGSPPMNFFEAAIEKFEERLVINTSGLRFPVPDAKVPIYQRYAGQRVIFGIRPEDIHDPAFAPTGPQTAPVIAKVDVIELMGKEMFLYLMAGDKSFLGWVDPRTTKVRVGDQMKVIFDMNNAHLFEPGGNQKLIQ